MNQDPNFLLSVRSIRFVPTTDQAEQLIRDGWVYWNTIANQCSETGHEIVLVKLAQSGQ